jgi:c-di-AMP phosphodiesterase-like protein
VQDFLAGYHRRSLNAHTPYSRLLSASELIEIPGWPRGMYSLASAEDCEGASDDEVSEAAHGFVSYALQVETVEWTFVATPRSDGSSKISFRSLPGSVNVKDLATLMGVGGGHDRAAGGRFEDTTPQEAARKVLNWCAAHAPPLDSIE